MFERCENMKWAKIPETTQRIGNRAFNNCTSLESLTPLFPSNVTSVGKVSFYNCCSLTGDVVFAGNTLLIEDVASYGPFENAKFTSVDFQTELGELPERAFFHCYDLKTVRFRDTLSGIGVNAFSGCTNLVSVTPFLPKNLTYLGGTAFYKTHALSGDLVFHSPDLEIEGESEYGHFYMSNIRSVTFEHEIERINNRMFNSCTNLSCLVFSGAAPTQIGEASFEGMSDYLPRVYVPDDETLWQTVPLGTLTAWSNLTDEEQQHYFNYYPSGAQPFAMWTISDSLHMWMLRTRENGLLMFLR